ncbi:hypothetical protein E2320_008099, partial [Naja naja]
MALLDFLLQ